MPASLLISVFVFRCLKLVLQQSKVDPQKYALNAFHPLRLAILHKETTCLQVLHEGGFRLDQTFYNSGPDISDSPFGASHESNGYGSLLCFSPTYEAAEYILKTKFDLSVWKPIPLDLSARFGEYDPVIESMHNARLTDLLLENGAKIGDSEGFWRRIFGVMKNQETSTMSIVRDMCFMYILIKHGCNVKTAIQQFFATAFYPGCEYRQGEVLFYMLYLLQVNIEPPQWRWKGLKNMVGKDMDVDRSLLQKIEGRS